MPPNIEDFSMFSSPQEDLSMFSQGEDLSMFSQREDKKKESSWTSYGYKLGSAGVLSLVAGITNTLVRGLKEDVENQPERIKSYSQKITSPITKLQEGIQTAATDTAQEAEQAKPEDFFPMLGGKTIALGMELPFYALATRIGGIVGGFAGYGALQEMGREGATKADVVKAATLNAAMGKVLKIADKIPGGKGVVESLKRGLKVGTLFGSSAVVGQVASQSYEAAKSEEVDFDISNILSKESLADTTLMTMLGILVGVVTKKGSLTKQQETEFNNAVDKWLTELEKQPVNKAELMGFKTPENMTEGYLKTAEIATKASSGELEVLKAKAAKKMKLVDRYITSGLLERKPDGVLYLTKSGEVNKNANKIIRQSRYIDGVNEWYKHPEYLEALKAADRVANPIEENAYNKLKAEEDLIAQNRGYSNEAQWTQQEKLSFIEEFKSQGQEAFNQARQVVESVSKSPPPPVSLATKSKIGWFEWLKGVGAKAIEPLKGQDVGLSLFIKLTEQERALAEKKGWHPFEVSFKIDQIKKDAIARGQPLSPEQLSELSKPYTFARIPTFDIKNLLPEKESFDLVLAGKDLRKLVLDTKALDAEILPKNLPEVTINVKPGSGSSGKYYRIQNKIEVEASNRTEALHNIVHELTHWANKDRFPQGVSYNLSSYDPVSKKISEAETALKTNADFQKTWAEVRKTKKGSSFGDTIEYYYNYKLQDSASSIVWDYLRLLDIADKTSAVKIKSGLESSILERRMLSEVSAHSSAAELFKTPAELSALKTPFELGLKEISKTYKVGEILPNEIIPPNPYDTIIREVIARKPNPKSIKTNDERLEQILGYKPAKGASLEAHEVLNKVGWIKAFIHGMKDSKGDFTSLEQLGRYIQTQPDIAKTHPTYRKMIQRFREELSGTSQFTEEYQDKFLPILRASLKEQKDVNKLVLYGEKITDPVKAKAFRDQATKLSPLFGDYLAFYDKAKIPIIEALNKEMKFLSEGEAKVLEGIIKIVQSDLVYFPHIWVGKWGNISANKLKSWPWFGKPLAVLDNLVRKGKLMDLQRGLVEEGGANFNIIDFSLRLAEQLPLRRLAKRYPNELGKVIEEIAEQDAKDFVMTFKHTQARQGVEGYNTDVIRVTAEYLNSLARVHNRAKYLPLQMEALAEIDSKTKLYQHARDTLRYHLSNKSFEMMKLRQGLTYFYLTALKSSLGQGAQVWTISAPYLSLLAKEFQPGKGSKSGYLRVMKETTKWGVRQVLSPERIKDMASFLSNLDKDLNGKKTFLSLASEGMGRLSKTARAISTKLVGVEESGTLALLWYYGYTKPTYVPELLGARGGTLYRQFTPRAKRLATFLLRNSEIYSKETTAMAAYHIFVNSGIPKMEAMHMAGKFTQDILADYSGIFKPVVARGVGATPMAFGIYPFFQAQHLKNLLFRQREFSAFAKIIAGTAFVGGTASATPFYFLWDYLYGKETGRDLKLDMTGAAKKLGDTIHPKAGNVLNEIVYGGLPSFLLGIDLSPQVQIADFPILRSGDVFGIMGNVVDKVRQAKDSAEAKNWSRFIETLSPEVLRMPLSGIRMKMYGLVSAKGTPTGFPSEVGQPISDSDLYKFLLGVYPSAVRKAGDFERAVRKHETWKAMAKTNIIDKLIVGQQEISDGKGSQKFEAAVQELNDWNNSVRPQDMISLTTQDFRRRLTQPYKAYRYFLEEELRGGEEE